MDQIPLICPLGQIWEHTITPQEGRGCPNTGGGSQKGKTEGNQAAGSSSCPFHRESTPIPFGGTDPTAAPSSAGPPWLITATQLQWPRPLLGSGAGESCSGKFLGQELWLEAGG